MASISEKSHLKPSVDNQKALLASLAISTARTWGNHSYKWVTSAKLLRNCTINSHRQELSIWQSINLNVTVLVKGWIYLYASCTFGLHVIQHMWKPEDNLQEWILLPPCRFQELNWWQVMCLYLPNHLDNPHAKLINAKHSFVLSIK